MLKIYSDVLHSKYDTTLHKIYVSFPFRIAFSFDSLISHYGKNILFTFSLNVFLFSAQYLPNAQFKIYTLAL